MRQKFIVGNWKMHTTTSEASRLAGAIVDGMAFEDGVSVAVCPPFPYLALVGEILKGSRVALGAQNLYPEKEHAREAHAIIRACFGRMFGEDSAGALPIQYGGIVKPDNAAELLSQHGVDGALIGGAGLHADQFLAIVRAGAGDPHAEESATSHFSPSGKR